MDETGLENDLLVDSMSVESGNQTFTFCAGNETVESAADGTSYLWNQEGCSEATEADLEEYYNKANNLQETFGSFENYLNYMTDREALIQSGEYDPGSWGSTVDTGGLKYQDPYGNYIDPDDYNNLSPNDFMSKYGLDKSEVEVIQVDTTKSRQDGYNEWLSSDAVQELNAEYGIDDTLRTEDGREYQWNGSGWVKVTEPDNMDFGRILKVLTAITGSAVVGNALGPIIGGAIGGPVGSAAGSGAVSGAISSTLGQLVVNGEVNPDALLQSILLGGLNGVANAAIAGELSGSALDNAIWDLSGSLDMSYEEVVNLLQGMASGAVTGDDLTDVVVGAVGGWTQSQTMDWLRNTFGDEVNVDDWFKDGQSNIPIEALEPIVDQIIGGIADGSIDDPGAWLKTVWDYFQQGGDVDFMLPPGMDIGDLFDSAGFDFSLCEEGSESWYCNIDLDLDGLPDWDIDIDLPNPCEEGQILNELGLCEWPDVDLPDVELPDIDIENPCEEGQILNELGLCEWPDVDLPDVDLPDIDVPKPECLEGYSWDEFLQRCIPMPDFDLPDIPNPCEEGQVLNELGLCEWPDIDIDVGIDTPDFSLPDIEGPDFDIDGPDIDIPNPCEEGQILDEAGLCQWPDLEFNWVGGEAQDVGPRVQLYDYTPWKDVDVGGVRPLLNPFLDDDNGMFS